MTIPIYLVEHLDTAAEMARLATGLGLKVTLFCNSAAARSEAISRGLSVDSAFENVGYGRAANQSVINKEFDWLIVCNDDISADPSDFSRYIGMLHQWSAETDPWIVGLTDVASVRRYAIPGPGGVFAGLSLLHGSYTRIEGIVRHGQPKPQLVPQVQAAELHGNEAFPFTCVAINRAAWLSVGGFDPRFDLYYEDMDFLIRLSKLGDAHVVVVPAHIHHRGSASTRQQLQATLPVATWSAYEYLVLNTRLSRLTARLLVVTALALRLVLVPFASGSRIDHAAGVARSLAAIVRNIRPRLPAWQR